MVRKTWLRRLDIYRSINAELWLSERLDAYLGDPDEVRAITRHLLHQPGTIACSASSVTVTIERPDQPRIARAMRLLTDEFNATQPESATPGRSPTRSVRETVHR